MCRYVRPGKDQNRWWRGTGVYIHIHIYIYIHNNNILCIIFFVVSGSTRLHHVCIMSLSGPEIGHLDKRPY